MHWDLVWDLVPDPSTFFRIWIRRHRGGVNTWNIEISFEGTLVPNREQSESLTETEDLDLGSHSGRGSRRTRAEKPCPWGLSAALALARSLARSLQQQQQQLLVHLHTEEICTPLEVLAGVGYKQTHSPSPALLTHAFFPKGYLRKLCSSFFLRFPRGFLSPPSLFLFLGKLGKGYRTKRNV
jgi:hypothetical protein